MKAKGERIVKFVDGQMRDFMIYDLVDKYDPILKEKAKEFDFNDPPIHPIDLSMSLAETMGKNGGIGLAAPQVGIPYRVFCMGLIHLNKQQDQRKMDVMTLFNPVIISQSEIKRKEKEGCITFPGLYLDVERSTEIVVQFTNHFGNLMQSTFYGIDARCALHEYDHLDGILYTSRIPQTKLKIIQSKMKRRR
jgi:peptide deformylase